MTLTSKTMEWLDQNRHRSYPMSREEWRRCASSESGLDCVLLDALVCDCDAAGNEELRIRRIEVGQSSTRVSMAYGGREFDAILSGGESGGEESFETLRGFVKGSGVRGASISLSFSSHSYIHGAVGEGTFDVECPLLKSRVVSLSLGTGVDSVSVNGSKGVDGHDSPASLMGDVVLEDGYRTSPIIYDGRIKVRVGRNFGYDPCMFDFGDEGELDCRSPMFFFCGQNAVNGGNVVLKGGRGVNVSQGRTYAVKSGTCAGRDIPCIEISATTELMDLYRPS